jgi:streptogramin lyase
VALDRDGNVWIANSGNGTIQKITVDTGTVSEQVNLGGSYFYGGLVDSWGYFWILDSSGGLMYKYDTSKFPDPTAFDTVNLGSIYGFTLDDNDKVWVAGSSSPSLYKIDIFTGILEETITVPTDLFGGFLAAVTFDIYGNIWITNDYTDSVLQYNPMDRTFMNFDVKGTYPHGLGADDDGFIYVINRSSNNITKLKALTGSIVLHYTVGNDPYTYSDLTGYIYRNVTLK